MSQSIPGVSFVEHASSIEVYMTNPVFSNMGLPSMEGRYREARVTMAIVENKIRDIIKNPANDIHKADNPDKILEKMTREFHEFAKSVGLGLTSGIVFPNDTLISILDNNSGGPRTPENLSGLAEAIRIATDEFVNNALCLSPESTDEYISESLIPDIEARVFIPEDPWVSISFSLENGDLVDFSSNVESLREDISSQRYLDRVGLALAVNSLDKDQRRKLRSGGALLPLHQSRRDNLIALKASYMDMDMAEKLAGHVKTSEPSP